MCKFIHIRERVQSNRGTGEILGKGGKTIAFEIEGQFVRYAVATCSNKENFCRRTGRNVAKGRLEVGKHHMVTIGDGQTYYDAIINEVARAL